MRNQLGQQKTTMLQNALFKGLFLIALNYLSHHWQKAKTMFILCRETLRKLSNSQQLI